MADSFNSIIIEMMSNLPDPNESVPLSNQKGTMFGVTIPFHILTWCMVAFRVHTRIRVVREPGLDDVFVVLAAVFNLISLITFLRGTQYGLGNHFFAVYLQLQDTMMWLYITNAAYHTTTALIKASLLFQYLRMFREGIRHKICIVLLCLVAVWGFIFSFMAWVPCFPVSGFWNRGPGTVCYGFGYRTVDEAKNCVLAFAASNMIFDIVIFAVPLSEYFRKDLKRKQLLAMTGLFALGSIVILMAVLRLWSVFKHSQSAVQSFDFTWWYPEVLIISCLEVDFAIMCASMPIFWPTVVASWSHIFVTNEVHISHHERLSGGSQENIELGRTGSMKSTASAEAFSKAPSWEYYKGYDTETGRDGRVGITKVEVQTFKQDTRML